MNASRLISLGLALALSATQAVALTPLAPCDGIEAQMQVHGASYFGHEESGFISEDYANLLNPDGQAGSQPGPIPQLNDFMGLRVTDCRSGRFVAIHGVRQYNGVAPMLATEFLRKRDKAEQTFRFGDVRRAAEALYEDNQLTRVLVLRESEETCACREFYPDRWR